MHVLTCVGQKRFPVIAIQNGAAGRRPKQTTHLNANMYVLLSAHFLFLSFLLLFELEFVTFLKKKLRPLPDRSLHSVFLCELVGLVYVEQTHIQYYKRPYETVLATRDRKDGKELFFITDRQV